jgi:hypothetical protein
MARRAPTLIQIKVRKPAGGGSECKELTEPRLVCTSIAGLAIHCEPMASNIKSEGMIVRRRAILCFVQKGLLHQLKWPAESTPDDRAKRRLI